MRITETMETTMTRWNFDDVTKTRTTDEGLPNKPFLWFHLFNPNGAVADWNAACQEIDEAVEAGRLKGGAIMAYGSLNYYHYEKLVRLVWHDKPKTFPTRYHVRKLQEAAAKARAVARGEG